ncbi:GDP-mannose 4,6-dehydratase [Candidatus Woesearchaeota archaeon]|nr:GDP-mannose 4,6-dehydratase [Candidatus Woesearchaeota archaeon]
MKKVLIFGITGQDGSYLAEFLLEKGYEVHGLIRKSATGNKKNIMHILDRITLHKGDLADATSIYRIIKNVNPLELYNFADQDHVSWSYDSVDYSFDITGAAVGRILEIIKQVNPKIKFFQPVSSNMFGRAQNPQNEETNFRPQSPYGCAKAFAYILTRYYRDVFGLFASTAIFYNHESPRRSEEYVTRKITKAAARISKGLQKKLYLGDINIKIDFGYSKDYVEAAWKILQLDTPEDFIICTGELHSIREFVEKAFDCVGLKADDYMEIDKNLLRPGKTAELVGDFSKAKKAFGYKPKVKFGELVKIMANHDLKEIEKEPLLSKIEE